MPFLLALAVCFAGGAWGHRICRSEEGLPLYLNFETSAEVGREILF